MNGNACLIENHPLNQSAVWDFSGNMDISSLCNDGICELEELGRLIKRVIEEEKKTLERKIEISKEQVGHDIEDFALDIHYVDEVFRRTLYYSYIVTIYSLLEKKLKAICELAQKNAQLERSYQDRQSSLLDQVKIYLKKVLQYDFSKKLDVQWQEINTFKNVRNAIVHKEGCIDQKDVEAIQRNSWLDLDGSNRIVIKHEYGSFVLKNVYIFVATICDDVLMKGRNKEILD